MCIKTKTCLVESTCIFHSSNLVSHPQYYFYLSHKQTDIFYTLYDGQRTRLKKPNIYNVMNNNGLQFFYIFFYLLHVSDCKCADVNKR